MRRPRRTPRRVLAMATVASLWCAAMVTPVAAVPPPPVDGTPPTVAGSTLGSADGLWQIDADGWPSPPSMDAAAWILVDVGSGQILAGHDASVPRPPASTTKLLTALAVSRRADGAQMAKVSANAASQAGASSGLVAGQQISVDDLLALLLLRSGNDAAVALAEHVAGTVEAFAALMSQEATILGLEGFVLAEPHGLEDRNLLTARHLAVVGRAVLADARLRPLVSATSWTLSNGAVVRNRNALLGAVPGATGLKTGMTTAAGWSLVASARRGPRHLVAVVLGATSDDERFTAAAELLEFGFASFTAPPSVPELMVRGDATWLAVGAASPRAVLPLQARVAFDPILPVELQAPVVRWTWPTTAVVAGQWTQQAALRPMAAQVAFAPITNRPSAPSSSQDRDAGILGAWLSGRVQAGLRAATVAGAWDD